MTGRSPARLLAPLALVATAVALFVVVSSGGSDTEQPADGATPAATSTATPEPTEEPRREREEAEGSGETYTVQPGDNPSTIAAELGVTVEELLEANPDVSPSALSPGQELEVP